MPRRFSAAGLRSTMSRLVSRRMTPELRLSRMRPALSPKLPPLPERRPR